MLSFLIHNVDKHGVVRIPPLTYLVQFGLRVRHTRKLIYYDSCSFEQIKVLFDWFFITAFNYVKYNKTLIYIKTFRRITRLTMIPHYQFWTLRAQYATKTFNLETPFMRLLPQITMQVVTRFTEPHFFTHFLSLLFLYSHWSPVLRWNKYKPHIFLLSHLCEWMGGYFCYIKTL